MQSIHAAQSFQAFQSFMEPLYVWGIQLIKLFQSASSPILTKIVLAITWLGNPAAYFIFLPIIYWCIDEKKGIKLSMVTAFSGGLNTIIKNYLQVPRPYYRDPSVKTIDESGFSTPSGHAQGTGVFWGLAPFLFIKAEGKVKNRRAVQFALALGVPFIVGLTRIYLGVHYPSDVILGWLIALVFVLLVLFLWPLAAKRLNPLPRSIKLLLLALVSLMMNRLAPEDTSLSAVFFGLGAGYLFLSQGRSGDSDTKAGIFSAAKGSPIQKALRLALGLATAGIIYFGLKKLLPGQESANYHSFRFIRYAVLGLWVSYGAPRLFLALRLAQPHTSQE